MTASTPATVTGGTAYTDVLGDNLITVDQTSNHGAVTVTAANGTDTINGGDYDLIVDASANTLSVEVSPALGATSILGGSGTLLVDPDGLGLEGPLTVQGGSGHATINGSTGGTTVIAGSGDIQIIADHALSIVGNDGAETLKWTPTLGDVINVTTVSGVTTVADTGTHISVSLSGGAIVVDATAASGTISDFANVLGTEVITLGSANVTVTASQGTDAINAGSGDLTVDASGNTHPITVTGGAGQLTFSAGIGNATIAGGTGATIVNGGDGTIALTQHGLTMVTAGDGTITVTSDGSQLSVTGEDGVSTANWTAGIGDTVTITTDSGTQVTTLNDLTTGARTVLASGYATNYISVPPGGGTINDLPDHNVIAGGPFPDPFTVIASHGTDTVSAGMSMDVTVNATGNANPIVVNGGAGTLSFTAGAGAATISGGSGGTTITGGTGTTALTQHGSTTIHAGDGTITVTADGSQLSVIGADGTSTNSWTFASGDTVTIATNGTTHVTTVSDPNGSLTYTLPPPVPPTLTIDSVNSGVTLNASQATAGFTINGTSDAEAGQTVTIKVVDGSSAVVGTYTTSVVAGGIWTVTVPGADHLADGSYTITANVSNLAGTPATQASQALSVDETAPMVAISSIAPVNAAAALAGFTISGTTDAEDGQVVTVTVLDGLIPLDTFPATVTGGAWSVHVSAGVAAGLADGGYSVTADVSDRADNAASPASQTLTVDETAPVVTIDGLGGPTNQPMQTVSGTATELGGTVTLWDGAASVGSATVGPDGHWSVTNVSLVGEGLHALTAKETDAAGNTGTSTPVLYTLDLTPPVVTIVGTGGLTNQPVQTVSGTATELGGTVTLWDGAVSVGSATVDPTGHWSTNVTLTIDGPHSLTAKETDAAGNTGASTQVFYTLDTTAPVVTIDSLGGPSNQLTRTVSGTASLSEIGRPVTILDGINPVGSTTVLLDGSWSTTVPLAVEGSHSLTASVADIAGNIGTSTAVTYTLDTTPPTLTMGLVDPVNAATAATGFTISGTTDAENGQLVSVQLFNGLALPVGSLYLATVSNGAWSVIVPGSDHLADGGYTVTANVTDQAGNAALPASQPFTVDETAPVVTIMNLGALTNQPMQIVSGMVDPTELGQTVTIWDGSVSVGSGTVQIGGVWSASVALTGDGAHSLTARVTDAAGNTGTSAAVRYTLDTTAPAVTILGTGGLTNQASQMVAGTAEPGGTVIVWDGATSVASATVAGDGTWSAGVNLGSDGAHSLTATETDAAGNTGTSGSSVDYTLDTVAPTVAITSLGRSTNQPTQTVSGTAEAGGTVVVWDGTTALGTAIAASDGSWSATVALAGNGSHSLTASETDGAGNTGTSNAVSYMLDTAPVASGDNSNPYAGAIGQRLADLLGSIGDLSYFGPNQPVPDSSTGTPTLLISGNDGTPVVVPDGVAVVWNQVAGVDLRGSGQANQVVVSSAGFTYHSNGGSGIVLADDAQAGGPAGNSNIVLARSGGGDFVISTGSGDDTVDAASGNVSVAAGGGHNLVFLSDGNALVTSAGVDTVVSGTGAATVQATAGSQALVFGGASTLTFMGGTGAATVVGGAGNTNLTAGSGSTVFWGSENGGNTMYAGTGAATLVGGGSGNVIHAGGSADLLLVAGTGNSTLVGGSATGNNFYWGSQGDDVISAGQGNDTIIGGSGHDTIQASGGTALIFGGNDGNTFVAGSGSANIVSGNGGANTFAFINGQAGGTEVIWDFRSGTDHLSLQGYGANELANATAGAHSYGPGTQIGLSDGTKIIFGDIATLSRTTLS